jgi:hypothetical protein
MLRQTNCVSSWKINCYYSSPELFDLQNELHTDAVGTVRSNRKELPKDIMKCKLKKGEVAVSYRNKLMALKWKDKNMGVLMRNTSKRHSKTSFSESFTSAENSVM